MICCINNNYFIPPLLLNGFIYAYHPATPGSNPKHTICTFNYIQIGAIFVMWKERK